MIDFKPWAMMSILAMPLPSWSGGQPPEAPRLLRRVLTPPSQAYEGVLIVTHSNGASARSEEVQVQFSPPNRYRWDFLNPDGSVQRIVESDGSNEFVWSPSRSHVVRGDAIKSAAKRMPMEEEFRLLLANYDLSGVTADNVAGRGVWAMELIPKSSGKAHRQLWVDKASGVILENKKYRPNENFSVVSRFVRFTMPGKVEEKHSLAKQKAVQHDLDPDFLSLDDWEKATGRTFFLPQELAQGFSFESIDFYPSEHGTVNHVRYTDGLTVLSIFETSHPVRAKKIKAPQKNAAPAFSLPETVVLKKQNGHYLTLVSDTSEDFLKAVAASLK